MKVLIFNGSAHMHGCTARALDEVEKTLHENGIETERIEIGVPAIRGCIGCGTCRQNKRCVFDDIVNETAPKMAEADGIVVGTPVYYAHANGQVLAFLDRLFYSTATAFDATMKVGAAVISSRRAGAECAPSEPGLERSARRMRRRRRERPRRPSDDAQPRPQHGVPHQGDRRAEEAHGRSGPGTHLPHEFCRRQVSHRASTRSTSLMVAASRGITPSGALISRLDGRGGLSCHSRASSGVRYCRSVT